MQCPENTFLREKSCVDDCGDLFIYNKECVNKCPDSHHFVHEERRSNEFHDYKLLFCSERCPKNTFVYEKFCMRACPEISIYSFNNSCITQCPDTHRLYRNITENGQLISKTCLENCTEYFPFRYGSKCLERCGPDLYQLEEQCFDACPLEAPFILSYVDFMGYRMDTVHCVHECPYGYFYRGKHCVENCMHWEYKFNNSCLENCPSSHPVIYYNALIANMEDKLEGFSSGGRCVMDCSPFLMFNENGKCVYSCELTFNGTCVTLCPVSHSFIDNGQCVTMCRSLQVNFNGTCIDRSDCVTGIIFDAKCVNNCPSGYMWLYSNHINGQHPVEPCYKELTYYFLFVLSLLLLALCVLLCWGFFSSTFDNIMPGCFGACISWKMVSHKIAAS